jgi:hypothetical protein
MKNDQRRPKITRHRSERGRGEVVGIEGTVNGKKEWSLCLRLMRKRKRSHRGLHLRRGLLKTTRSKN